MSRKITLSEDESLQVCRYLDDMGRARPNDRVLKLELWRYLRDKYPQTVDSNWQLEIHGLSVVVVEMPDDHEFVPAVAKPQSGLSFMWKVAIALSMAVGVLAIKKFSGH